jgi:hypothetical protein
MLALILALLQQTPAPQAPAPTAPAPQAAPKPVPPKPRYKVTPDQIQHLGSIGPREVRTLSYTITNEAKVPLSFRISNNSPGTTMDDAALKTPFAPGETRSLTMRIDPEGFVGYQRRAIKLEPQADEPYNFIFRADMTVRADLTVDAERKSMGAVAPYESPEAVFSFSRETGEPLEVKLETTPSPYLDAELEPKGAKAELRLTLRPNKLQHGQSAGLEILKVKTNAPLQPSFTLYLDWRLKRAVDVQPTRLVFGDPKERFESLELTSDKPFEIEGVDFDAKVLSLAGQTKGSAKAHRLTFYRRVDKASEGLLTIRIKGVAEPIALPVLLRLP